MSTNPEMISWSLSTKQFLINIYVGAGNAAGFEAAQRMTREIGEVVTEIHGRDKAAVLLYGVADAVAIRGELPKLPLVAPPPRATPQGMAGRVGAFVRSRSCSWLLLGIIAGMWLPPLLRLLSVAP